MKKSLYLLLFALSFYTLHSTAQTVVATQNGAVSGASNGNIIQFLGIPFAKPPIGQLRWRMPEQPETWSDTLETLDFKPVCPQKRYEQGDTAYTLEGNEDCLYLNVWTPSLSGNHAVMVFIHGGGNQQGGASQITGGTSIYFGKNLAERGDVVVVTIQYRIGALGLLVHPGLESESPNGKAGNYGPMDQILALKWVRENIQQFGGDPNRVMIFGESAGGVNVGNLLTSPQAEGLFQRACIQSATPFIAEYETEMQDGVEFVDQFAGGIGNAEAKIAFLRTLPADSFTVGSTNPLEGGIVQLNWQPVADGFVFPGLAFDVIQTGNFNKVPLIIGSNSEEMSLSAPPTVTPTLVNILLNLFVPASLKDEALALYPPGTTSAEARESYIGILTDGQFTSTARRVAQCIRKNQSEPVYRYFFTHKHTLPQLAILGSYHGMELFYVFNNWENAALGTGPLFKPEDASVQENMLGYWTNFAKTGDPNGTGLELWPVYDPGKDCYMEIKASPDGSACGLRTPQSNLWDEVAGFMGCASSATQESDSILSLSVFPNPTTGLIQFELEAPFEITIFNSAGRAVLHKICNTPESDLTLLVPGLYFIRVKTANKVYLTKIYKD